MVISPEHALLKAWLEKGIIKNAEAVKAYPAEAARKSAFARSELNKEKTGVQLAGVMGINPVNETEIPITPSSCTPVFSLFSSLRSKSLLRAASA